MGDYYLNFSFFSLKGEKSATELKFERGIKGFNLYFETESDIPLITGANVEGCEEVTLTECSNSFSFMYWKFRITNLRSIAVQSNIQRNHRTFRSFCNKSDKVRFLLRAAIEGSVYMLLAYIFVHMFIIGENMTDDLIWLGIGVCFLTSAVRRIIYLIRAKRWRVA